MNYFLILIILGLGWGGFYEYNQLVQQNARDKREFQDTLNTKMTQLQDENTKLQAENTELTKDLAEAKAKLGPTTNGASSSNSTSGLSAFMATPTAPATPKVSLPSNDLGLITTTDGNSFQKCHLLKINATGIVISSSTGITEIKFVSLPQPLQTRFGFSPQNGPVLSEDQVATLEQQRQISEQASKTGP